MLMMPKWTDHAGRRKKQYSITEEEIADTWLFGEAYRKDNNGWRIVGIDVTLVVADEGDVIITMYRNACLDRHFASAAKLNKTKGTIRGITFIT